MTGFQTQVNIQPAPGIAGVKASANPAALYVTGPGGLVAGANGVAIAGFGWATPITNGERVDSNAALVADGVVRYPSGFVANTQQGNFTTYLAESGMAILAGQAMELVTRGDFWAKMLVAGAARGNRIFANLLDGTVCAAATGSTIAANTFTASFATNVMTVTVAPALPLKVGQAIVSAGVAAGTYIKALGTGTGGTGTYTLTTAPGTITAQAATGTDWIETPRWVALSASLVNEIAKIGFGE